MKTTFLELITLLVIMLSVQYAQADSSVVSIDPDGSVRIKSNFDPVALPRNQHIQRFHVTCPVTIDNATTYFGGALKIKNAGVSSDFDLALDNSYSVNRDGAEFAFGETKYVRHNEGFSLTVRVTGNTFGFSDTVWLGGCRRADTGAIVPLTLGNVTQN